MGPLTGTCDYCKSRGVDVGNYILSLPDKDTGEITTARLCRYCAKSPMVLGPSYEHFGLGQLMACMFNEFEKRLDRVGEQVGTLVSRVPMTPQESAELQRFMLQQDLREIAAAPEPQKERH